MIKSSSGERLFDTFNIILITLFSISILIPFWQQIAMSFSTVPSTMISQTILWPVNFSFRSYELVFKNNNLLIAYRNTLFKTFVGTFLMLIVTGSYAYALSKKYLIHRNFFTLIILLTMFIGGGLIPTYLLIRKLGLYNNILVYVIPYTFMPVYVIYIRNYLMTLPIELEESAKVDGANDIIIWYRIFLPLSKPIIATVSLWNMVASWNSWFDSMIYTTRTELMTLGYLLQRLLIQNITNIGTNNPSDLLTINPLNITPETLKAATLIVVILPILFAYPFLQKYFIKGIIVGSLKG